ncbi:hypothetical protein EJ02DRAFT_402146 [Clathrospora elynae]|uniref:CENP-V/GFA domain-containing protein n=1 Tax=Clathrospora elynae TaxID=706981 RepID=A0A6A5SPR8_9PLEO|nr:hypothetical protein EJ02DRAFT_402146 [Clathrospora elynae]
MSEAKQPDVALPTAPSADAPTEMYNASCHCGAFVYSILASPPLNDPATQVMECNCSICSRNGYLFIYVPNTRVTFQKGSIQDFRSYSFGSRKMGHYFCGTCGASCMARSTDPTFFAGLTCVNVRMLENVDVKTLKLKFADGKSYTPPDAAAAAAA